MPQSFLDDQTNVEIIGLLFISKLDEREKQLWLSLLPRMTEQEKLDLKSNLEKELEYEMSTKQKAQEDFIGAFQQGI